MALKQSWLSIPIAGLVWLLSAPADAQITPDQTLGNQRSQLTPVVPGLDLIGGGAQRGTNLFHSFSQFNIGNGQAVYFANPTGVQNILTRVTGSTASNIQGLLGVAGTANLFLLNPNGIIFGANAQLDIRGSFVGSTANAIQFGNQGSFSATNPEAPPLLTVQPSAFLFTQLPSGQIQNQSRADAGSISSDIQAFGLRVGDGQSLLLVGGDINLNNAGLFASGGRIELGGLAAPGTIKLAVNGGDFRLGFPSNVTRSNLSIENNSQIYALGGTGGGVAIHAQDIFLDRSSIQAGLLVDNVKPVVNTGTININASGKVTLDQDSGLLTTWGLGTSDRGGNITVNADSIQVLNGSGILTIALQGSPGDIALNAADTILIENSSGVASLQTLSEQGKAGDINISTGNLILNNASFLGSLPTATQGNSGDINIVARDRIIIEGGTTDNSASAIISSLLQSQGKGGNVTIDTGSLILNQQGNIATTTLGQGDAGQITIRARDEVKLDGGRILSSVEGDAQGKGGDIAIQASSLSITNGGGLNAASQAIGSAGNIQITVSGAMLVDGVSAADAPSTITTSLIPSLNNLQVDAVGGNINIDAGSLTVSNQGLIISSGILRRGNAGDINITVRENLTVSDRAYITTLTLAQGNAGKIRINAGDTLAIAQASGISASSISLAEVFDFLERLGLTRTELAQRAGQSLEEFNSVLDFIQVKVGSANDIEINARVLRLDQQSFLTTSSGSVDGGNIRLQLRDLLLLRNNSEISTTSGVLELGGNGGDITIDSPLIVAVPKEGSYIRANAFTGRGGSVNIQTDGLFGIAARSTVPNFRPSNDVVFDFTTGTPASQPSTVSRSEITASSQLGVQGNVSITQPDVQPTQGTIELPINLIDTSNQIAQVCRRGVTGQSAGRFVVSGRGSVPPSPTDPLADAGILSPLATPEASSISTAPTPSMISPPEIIEAQGWVKSPDGKVALVAPSSEPSATSQTPATCSTLIQK